MLRLQNRITIADDSSIEAFLLLFVLIPLLVWAGVALARWSGSPPHQGMRTVSDPSGPNWLTLDEAAERLGVAPKHLSVLVARNGIPFYVLSDGNSSNANDYRFRADELDAWAVG